MKIVAITRYKQGELYAILRRLGWTQAELGRRTELDPTVIGRIINLLKRPTPEQADRIQKALGEVGEFLDVLAEWPEAFKGFKPGFRREETAEVSMERLLDHPEVLQLAAPEADVEDGLKERVEEVMGELSPRLQYVLRERFWNGETLEAIGRKVKRTRDAIRGAEARALRKLRNPERVKRLLGLRNDVPLAEQMGGQR